MSSKKIITNTYNINKSSTEHLLNIDSNNQGGWSGKGMNYGGFNNQGFKGYGNSYGGSQYGNNQSYGGYGSFGGYSPRSYGGFGGMSFGGFGGGQSPLMRPMTFMSPWRRY